MSTQNPPTPLLSSAAQRSAGSFELVLGPVLMALIGLAIDSWLGTRPVFILVLTLWGTAGAIASIMFRYRRQAAADLEDRRARRTDPSGGDQP